MGHSIRIATWSVGALAPASRFVRTAIALACGTGAALPFTTAAGQTSPDTLRPEDRRGTQLSIPASALEGAYGNALRLARALNDDALVASLLSQRALDPGATPADLTAVVDAFEALGDLRRATTFLKERARLFPAERETRLLLANLYARAGDAASAVAVWKEIDTQGAPPLSAAEAEAYARELDVSGDSAGAYRILRSTATHAPEDAKDFWNDLATLAWELDDSAEALVAYRVICRHRFGGPTAVQRLMQLDVDVGAIDEAIAAGLDEFRSEGDTSTLLETARLQQEKGDWKAVMRTLDMAESQAREFSQKQEFWLLRAEAFARLGNATMAKQAYGNVLAIDPSSVAAQAALLWDALDRNDDASLRRYIDLWRPFAEGAFELWAPFAVGLDRIGRSSEAIPFFTRHLRTQPTDYLFALEFSDALEHVGNAGLAVRLRRFAVGRLQHDSLASLTKANLTLDERQVLEETATTKRQFAGVETGERWFHAIRKARAAAGDANDVSFALDWYLAEDRIDSARRLIDSQRRSQDTSIWNKYRLSIALAEDDFAAIHHLLATASGIDTDQRIDALVVLDRDRLAGAEILDALDHHADDSDTLNEKLLQIRDRHAPMLRLGGTYVYIGGLDVYGPAVGAAADWGPARVLYSASAVQMQTPLGGPLSGVEPLSLRAPVDEAEAGAMARFTSERGATEISAALNVQPAQSYQGATPIPKATFFDQRLLTDVIGTTIQAVVDDKIEDTSLLRVAALQSRLEVGVRADFARNWYTAGSLHAREDYSRLFQPIGTETGEEIEGGYKIVTREPEWDVGLQGIAVQRWNNGLPANVAALVPSGQDLALYIPPTYELVSIVTHLTRGDFWQRYRPDKTAFPRYDCEAAFGILFPDLDGAYHLQCSVSALVNREGGYVSAVAFFNRGVAGIENQTNAEATVSYSQPF
ncbi:MAG TPA: tetratricopeptide repeat protein [Polyangiaceae bacterium]|nr:tetratricopeptide repeat protein [Polyangiaceae bacterium]